MTSKNTRQEKVQERLAAFPEARFLHSPQSKVTTLQIFGPVFAGGILMLATTLVILGILALHIAHAQYQAWKQKKTRIFPS